MLGGPHLRQQADVYEGTLAVPGFGRSGRATASSSRSVGPCRLRRIFVRGLHPFAQLLVPGRSGPFSKHSLSLPTCVRRCAHALTSPRVGCAVTSCVPPPKSWLFSPREP